VRAKAGAPWFDGAEQRRVFKEQVGARPGWRLRRSRREWVDSEVPELHGRGGQQSEQDLAHEVAPRSGALRISSQRHTAPECEQGVGDATQDHHHHSGARDLLNPRMVVFGEGLSQNADRTVSSRRALVGESGSTRGRGAGAGPGPEDPELPAPDIVDNCPWAASGFGVRVAGTSGRGNLLAMSSRAVAWTSPAPRPGAAPRCPGSGIPRACRAQSSGSLPTRARRGPGEPLSATRTRLLAPSSE